VKLYAQIVEMSGGRLVLLPMDDGSIADRCARTMNAGHAVALVLEATWADADARLMPEFKAIGDAAGQLVKAVAAFKAKASGELRRGAQ
jgi:hypothetical protein